MCRPSIRGRCIFLAQRSHRDQRPIFFRARELRHERGALNLPPREATQSLCKKLKSLSVFKEMGDFDRGTRPHHNFCIFYMQNLASKKSSQIFQIAGGPGQGPRGFKASTHKERRCSQNGGNTIELQCGIAVWYFCS